MNLNDIRAMLVGTLGRITDSEFIEKNKDKMFIAGGVFSNIKNNIPITDIDVFFKTKETRDEFLLSIENNIGKEKAFERRTECAMWIDSCNFVISDKFIGSEKDIIKTFDFRASMIYCSLEFGEKIEYYSIEAMVDCDLRNLTINTLKENNNSNIILIARAMKKLSQGYAYTTNIYSLLGSLLDIYKNNSTKFSEDLEDLKRDNGYN